MKVAFNILVAAIVIGILWSAFSGIRREPDTQVAVSAYQRDWNGARSLKCCKNYFARPISVAHDPGKDVLYVANVVDETTAGGYVCRTSITGEVLDTLRIDGITSLGGVTVLDNYVYIADGKRLLKYSIDLDSVSRVYEMPYVQHLGAVSHDKKGNVYVSDSHKNSIYRIENDSIKLFCQDSLCSNINGMCISGTTLMAGAGNLILRIDSLGRAWKYTKLKFSVFGICSDEAGNFLVSDFVGNVYAVSQAGQQLLVKKHASSNAAGIEYIPDQKMLFVPTYNTNSLEIFEVGNYL
ncbi:MAG: hypothetical protein MJZ61_01455 [Bacteroidales bacterium]|nr:hypothetical protein [Bacteroidales bacterium]